MKKVILLLVFVVAGFFSAKGQGNNSVNFQLQEHGIFLSKDGKDYVVLDFPNENQSDLYNKILVAITGIYTSPKDVISKVENQIISVHGYKKNALIIPVLLNLKAYYDISYVLKFQFKDGKIRVEAPVIAKMIYINSNKGPEEENIYSFFAFENPKISGNEKKDEKRKKWAEKQNKLKQGYMDMVSSTVNELVNNILFSTKKNDTEDW